MDLSRCLASPQILHPPEIPGLIYIYIVTKYRYRAPAAERYGHKKNKNFTSYGSGADDTDRDNFETS